MLIPRFAVWIFPLGIMVLDTGVVSGQQYPNKLIRIVTAEAGGALDFPARLIVQGLSGSMGQQVMVDNRSSLIAIETVAKAPPDGYTLLFMGNPLWVLPLLQNVRFDPVKDFSPISLANMAPSILAVHPSLPVKSVRELIALAKTRPGELNYASPATGTSPHLAAELFKAMAGVNIVRIPYKGAGPALNGLIGGEAQLAFAIVTVGMPHVKSGRIRALAITSAESSALFPGLPTVAASGLPGYQSVSIYGIFAPAQTPAAPITRLNQEIVRVLNQPDIKEKFLNTGSEVVGSSPEEFAIAIKAEMATSGKVIKDAGIRAD